MMTASNRMAKLGQGPFEAVGFWAPDEVLRPGDARPSGDADLGHCACCGAAVSWRVIVQNLADGECHVIGRTCAKKAATFFGTNDDQLKVNLKRTEKAYQRRQQAIEDARLKAEEDKKNAAKCRLQVIANLERDVRLTQVIARWNYERLVKMIDDRAAGFEEHWGEPLFIDGSN